MDYTELCLLLYPESGPFPPSLCVFTKTDASGLSFFVTMWCSVCSHPSTQLPCSVYSLPGNLSHRQGRKKHEQWEQICPDNWPSNWIIAWVNRHSVHRFSRCPLDQADHHYLKTQSDRCPEIKRLCDKKGETKCKWLSGKDRSDLQTVSIKHKSNNTPVVCNSLTECRSGNLSKELSKWRIHMILSSDNSSRVFYSMLLEQECPWNLHYYRVYVIDCIKFIWNKHYILLTKLNVLPTLVKPVINHQLKVQFISD